METMSAEMKAVIVMKDATITVVQRSLKQKQTENVRNQLIEETEDGDTGETASCRLVVIQKISKLIEENAIDEEGERLNTVHCKEDGIESGERVKSDCNE